MIKIEHVVGEFRSVFSEFIDAKHIDFKIDRNETSVDLEIKMTLAKGTKSFPVIMLAYAKTDSCCFTWHVGCGQHVSTTIKTSSLVEFLVQVMNMKEVIDSY